MTVLLEFCSEHFSHLVHRGGRAFLLSLKIKSFRWIKRIFACLTKSTSQLGRQRSKLLVVVDVNIDIMGKPAQWLILDLRVNLAANIGKLLVVWIGSKSVVPFLNSHLRQKQSGLWKGVHQRGQFDVLWIWVGIQQSLQSCFYLLFSSPSFATGWEDCCLNDLGHNCHVRLFAGLFEVLVQDAYVNFESCFRITLFESV